MQNKLKFTLFYLISLFTVITCLSIYVFSKYDFLINPITSLEINFSTKHNQQETPLVYVSSDDEAKINFRKVYKLKKNDEYKYKCDFDSKKKIRRIRVYFPIPTKNIEINSINVKTTSNDLLVPFKKIKDTKGVTFLKKNSNLKFDVSVNNAFIEIPNIFIYKSDLSKPYILILLLIVISIIILVIAKCLTPISIKRQSVSELSILVFITSIFLPHPTFNVALILMVVLNIKRISTSAIKSNLVNLSIIFFFLIYLISNLFLSKESYEEISTIERLAPLFILSIILPSIAKRRFLELLPHTALILGFVFLTTSIFDVYVTGNFEYLSFNHFTKFLHPVYFSYLLFFSICYISHYYLGYKKYILEFILFLFIIFSGSKMVFLFSLVAIALSILKKKRTILLLLPLVFLIVLFTPLKKRFNQITNNEDLSILGESHISNVFDKRINGLTFRLILWRETLATMSGLDYIFGQGVTDSTDQLLEDRIKNIGLLEHIKYNPHNQYVDTFWRTGVIGLITLISIPLICFITAFKNKDTLLMEFSLFFIFVMLSESIFGRVNGVLFFATITLILINTTRENENSNIRN